MIALGLIPLPLQLVACSTVIISRYGWGHYRKIHTLPTALTEVVARWRRWLICAESYFLLPGAVVDVTCDTPVADVTSRELSVQLSWPQPGFFWDQRPVVTRVTPLAEVPGRRFPDLFAAPAGALRRRTPRPLRSSGAVDGPANFAAAPPAGSGGASGPADNGARQIQSAHSMVLVSMSLTSSGKLAFT